jgi:hypothetical protein
MKLTLTRFSGQSTSTLGLLFVDNSFECFTLEDEERVVKIKGETRIPEGTYQVKKREVLSGLTKKYRDRFDFFDYHFMLQDVPGFEYVYIHIGNDETNTDGCLLVGDGVKSNRFDQKNNLQSSTSAFERLYKRLSGALDITIEIKNARY